MACVLAMMPQTSCSLRRSATSRPRMSGDEEADDHHVGVGPAARTRERRVGIEERPRRLQVAQPAVAHALGARVLNQWVARLNVRARAERRHGADKRAVGLAVRARARIAAEIPLPREAHVRIAHRRRPLADAPVAILNHHRAPCLAEQLRVPAHVEHVAATVNLDAVKVESAKHFHVANVARKQVRSVLHAHAVVEVPSHVQASPLAIRDKLRQVVEPVLINHWSTSVVMKVLAVGSHANAALPRVVQPAVLVAQLKQGHSAIVAVHGLCHRVNHTPDRKLVDVGGVAVP
eukprot:1673108-Pleurochrysis_carterae.AAC.3